MDGKMGKITHTGSRIASTTASLSLLVSSSPQTCSALPRTWLEKKPLSSMFCEPSCVSRALSFLWSGIDSTRKAVYTSVEYSVQARSSFFARHHRSRNVDGRQVEPRKSADERAGGRAGTTICPSHRNELQELGRVQAAFGHVRPLLRI